MKLMNKSKFIRLTGRKLFSAIYHEFSENIDKEEISSADLILATQHLINIAKKETQQKNKAQIEKHENIFLDCVDTFIFESTDFTFEADDDPMDAQEIDLSYLKTKTSDMILGDIYGKF